MFSKEMPKFLAIKHGTTTPPIADKGFKTVNGRHDRGHCTAYDGCIGCSGRRWRDMVGHGSVGDPLSLVLDAMIRVSWGSTRGREHIVPTVKMRMKGGVRMVPLR